jgi:hypothetical protein
MDDLKEKVTAKIKFIKQTIHFFAFFFFFFFFTTVLGGP